MKKAASGIGYIIIILLVITAAFTFLAPHFGWRVDAVLSGSMEPEIHTGGLVVTRPVALNEILPGDVITFYAPVTSVPTTHRVVRIDAGPPLVFHTKGDANEEADITTIEASNVVGTVWFNIPYLGYVTRFIKTPLGLLVALCLPGIFIIITETRNIRRAFIEREII